jgi:hypothetical protein
VHQRYLIGGIGNQLFQIATAPADTKFCTILLGRLAAKALNWSHHDVLLPIKDSKKLSNIQAFLTLPVVALDLCLARVFRVSIATDFDLNFVKCKSVFKLYSIGYFQDLDVVALEKVNSTTLMSLEEWGAYTDVEPLVLHIRGGDALLPKNQSVFSAPNLSWLRQQLEAYNDSEKIVTVVSNDREYAERLLEPFSEEYTISFKCNLTIEDTLTCALRSRHFIGSHSTLSFWICVLRQNAGKSSSIPDVMRHDFLRVLRSGRYVESSI